MQLRALDIGLSEWSRTTRPRKPSWERADTLHLDMLARSVAAYRGLPTTEKQLCALRYELRDRIETEPSLTVLRDFFMRTAKGS